MGSLYSLNILSIFLYYVNQCRVLVSKNYCCCCCCCCCNNVADSMWAKLVLCDINNCGILASLKFCLIFSLIFTWFCIIKSLFSRYIWYGLVSVDDSRMQVIFLLLTSSVYLWSAVKEVADKVETLVFTPLKVRRILKGHQGKVLCQNWAQDRRRMVSSSQV